MSLKKEVLHKSLETKDYLLYDAAALNNHCELTKLGRHMAEFSMVPFLSKSIIWKSIFNVQSSVFYRTKDKKFHADKARQNSMRPGGDHFMLLNVWEQVGILLNEL
ncbi:5382_t:CDS:2 [Diversispora eburnea]|uniref:5382_t:CDS:1 n=1 Tax=Diversispora eburnea TaxID=1213867 RepID=A0A9N9GC27_9GLOM|nr:5382_t:CDS:2 [Diversispora eburnea]